MAQICKNPPSYVLIVTCDATVFQRSTCVQIGPLRVGPRDGNAVRATAATVKLPYQAAPTPFTAAGWR